MNIRTEIFTWNVIYPLPARMRFHCMPMLTRAASFDTFLIQRAIFPSNSVTLTTAPHISSPCKKFPPIKASNYYG